MTSTPSDAHAADCGNHHHWCGSQAKCVLKPTWIVAFYCFHRVTRAEMRAVVNYVDARALV